MEDIKIAGDRVNDALKRHGVDKAGFWVTETRMQEFNVDSGEFSLYRTLFDQGLTLTVYHQDRKGSVATNKLDDASIEGAVADALAAAESGVADAAYDIAPNQGEHCFHDRGYEPDMEGLFERTRELMADIEKNHPKILVNQLVVSHKKIHTLYRNTNGTECEVFKGNYMVSMAFAGHEGDVTTSLFGTGVMTDNLDTPFMELGTVETQMREAEAQLVTVPLEGKFEGAVILTPDSLGSFLYSILSNFTGDAGILEKTSLWLEKLGEKVADERLTIALKPSDPRVVDRDHVTADGFLEEDYDMIKDGVLKSFMLSLYVANKSGFDRAKNSSFSVVIEGGETPYEELLKGIKKGLIVGRFSGGRPGSNGEFSGVAKNSFLIEDGKITGAVSETMISGNLAEMLMNVIDISRETVADGTGVLPYIAFDKIMISGKA
ncbi:MAG: TldD/PmbA family protein [Blautia sp.]|nr:TldD/PmbA family protein [Blautia sp.]